jgi:hypothetical protein
MRMDRVDQVLASLREERDRLAAELARVEQAIASLEGNATAAAVRPYALLTLYEATEHYLKSAGEPKTTREIAIALRNGGFRTRSPYLTGIVSTMLRRPVAKQFGIRNTRDGKRWYVKT